MRSQCEGGTRTLCFVEVKGRADGATVTVTRNEIDLHKVSEGLFLTSWTHWANGGREPV